MSSTPCPICQCEGGVLDIRALSITSIDDICVTCREVLNPKSTKKKEKEPARGSQARARRKPRAGVPGERIITTIPGVSRPMVDSRQALNENYTILQARERQLHQAIAELEKQMALRNQPLPPAPVRARPIVKTEGSGKRSPTDLEVDVLADAFGVMSMREKSGQGQFVGPTASSEYLLQQIDKITKRRRSPRRDLNSPPPQISCFEDYPELILLEAQFPDPPPQPPMELGRFLDHLPEYEYARQMFENYIYYVTWITSPIPLPLLSEILDLFYPNKCPIDHIDLQKGHRLAILFAVCLLGSYFDMYVTAEERTANCSKYRTLARAAMSAVPLSSSATVGGIQCIVLLMWFSRFCPTTSSSMDYQFAFSGYIAKFVQSLGLHTNGRDNRYAYVQDSEGIRRAEQTFWEYYTQDIFQSYFFGRPVTLHPSAVSCQYPEPDMHDENYAEFPAWKYSMSMIMAEIIETTVKTTVPYKTVMKFDRQLRKHPVPKSMEWPNLDKGIQTGHDSLGRVLQRAFGSILTQIVLMVLHRPYFWEAVSKPDHDLMKHPYWRSVVAAYHSATSLISSTLVIWELFPQAVEKFAAFWSHCHSASLVLGAMVTLRPDSQFARESLRHLNSACDMFRAADQSATKHLAPRMSSLFRLQRKAEQTYDEFLASSFESADPFSSPDVLSPASLSCLEDAQSPGSVDSKPESSCQEDGMTVDPPGVYRLQEKGWDHLILQLGRNS